MLGAWRFGAAHAPPQALPFHPKVARRRCGRSSVGITIDLHGHVMAGMQADAAEQVDAAIRGAVKPRG